VANTRTLAQLVAEVREQANIVGMDAKWTAAKVERRVDLAYSAFRELVSDAGHPYYLRIQAVTCSVPSSVIDLTNDDLTLPTDCVRVHAMDLIQGTRSAPLEPLTLNERHNYYGSQLGVPTGFRIGAEDGAGTDGAIDRTVRLYPRPAQAYTVHVTYLPQHTTLSVSSALDGVNGWEWWIVLNAACQILSAEADGEQLAMVTAERAKIEVLIKTKRRHRQRVAPGRITGARRGRMPHA